MTRVRCDGLTVNFRPILRLIVVASASRAPPMTIQTGSSGVFSILGVARSSAARRLAPSVRKRGAREDEVSGTTRPFCMTRAQHSRIAVNTASMAALIFLGSRFGIARDWQPVLRTSIRASTTSSMITFRLLPSSLASRISGSMSATPHRSGHWGSAACRGRSDRSSSSSTRAAAPPPLHHKRFK
jgi:hypothetical protein